MPYEDLVRKILTEGTLKSDRTGTGTISLFGQQMRFNLKDSFPLLTTKTVFFKGLAYELLWFLKGSTIWGRSTARSGVAGRRRRRTIRTARSTRSPMCST